MKKILIDYRKGIDLKNINCYGVIVNLNNYSLSPLPSFNLNDSLELSELIKKNNKKSFVLMDKIITEFELDELKNDLIKIINSFDFIIYSDMAIFSLVSDKKKLIYYPKTLVNSSKEISFYNNYQVNVVISNELSLEEIKEIDNNNCNYIIEAFGFHQMFYSKRNLLSLYKENFKVRMKGKNKLYLIKEELRNEFYPIIEKDDSTLIYTDYCYFLFEELNDLKNYELIYLNSSFISDKTYLNVIDMYYNFINGSDYKIYLNKVKKSHIKLSKGFLKQKSVLLKVGASDE